MTHKEYMIEQEDKYVIYECFDMMNHINRYINLAQEMSEPILAMKLRETLDCAIKVYEAKMQILVAKSEKRLEQQKQSLATR